MTTLTRPAPSHTPAEPKASAQPEAGPAVYWGDRLALRVWFAGTVFLWTLALAGLIGKLVGR